MTARTIESTDGAKRARSRGRRDLRRLVLLVVSFVLLALVLASIGLLNVVDLPALPLVVGVPAVVASTGDPSGGQ